MTGLGGWLAFFTLTLCISLLTDGIEFFTGFLPTSLEEWHLASMHGPLALMLVVYVACLAVNMWALVALFAKKKALRRIYLLLWFLSAAFHVSALSLLTVPGVTLQNMTAQYSSHDIVRAVAEQIRYALWFWYLSVSVRVRNTMVN
jgi:hypothetical protein